jgi:hypothetical protein
VLQAESSSPSGGVHHWLKRRSIREERTPVTRNDDNNSLIITVLVLSSNITYVTSRTRHIFHVLWIKRFLVRNVSFKELSTVFVYILFTIHSILNGILVNIADIHIMYLFIYTFLVYLTTLLQKLRQYSVE